MGDNTEQPWSLSLRAGGYFFHSIQASAGQFCVRELSFIEAAMILNRSDSSGVVAAPQETYSQGDFR